MIDTIIFDIGNVLAYFSWAETFRKYFTKEEFEEVAEITIRDEKSWGIVDKSSISFDEYIDMLGEKSPKLKEKIREVIIKTYKEIVPFDYAESWLKDLCSRGYKVYILSNYGEVPYALSKERFTFLQHTHGGVISYEIKEIKPDEAIYFALINKYNIKPENAVFIDDKIENTQTAERLGIKSIHFQEYKNAKEQLENLLIK